MIFFLKDLEDNSVIQLTDSGYDAEAFFDGSKIVYTSMVMET